MKVVLDITKPLDQNAAFYYELAKKAKRKLAGAKEAYEKTLQKLSTLEEQEQLKAKKKEQKVIPRRKKQWYEKFRWFYTSEGFLCIGGRDATTNDILIKKHTEKGDLVFHTELAGAPFFLLKAGGKVPGQASIQEAAQAAASYSKAWSLGLSSTEVYHVTPEQLSKSAPAGQYLGKGAFMVHGKRAYYSPGLAVAIGKEDNDIIGGPPSAVQAKTKDCFIVIPGDKKPSDLAKALQKRLGGTLEEIQAFLPPGKGRFALR